MKEGRMNRYDVVIIGAGLSGATFARKAAEKGKKVLVLEKREHVAGNVFDFKIEGSITHKYGPHIFHTNNQDVFNFLDRFTTFNEFTMRANTLINGDVLEFPVSIESFAKIYRDKSKDLISTIRGEFEEDRVPVVSLMESEIIDISEFGKFIFESAYKNYIKKMWGRHERSLNEQVIRRVPVVIRGESTYFKNKYEGIPNKGYTEMVKEILDHDLIQVKTGVDAIPLLSIVKKSIVFEGYSPLIVYTGPLDSLFSNVYGKLPYRTLEIKFNIMEKDKLGGTMLSMPNHKNITRKVDHTYFNEQPLNFSVISTEIPSEYNGDSNTEPYYPIPSESAISMYMNYQHEASKYPNLLPLGRLAKYKYMNMDEVVEQALSAFSSEFGDENE